MTAPLVSIVLPVHQQADQIDGIVQDYEAVMQRLPGPHELLLVVNGSSDGTMTACESVARRWPHVHAHEIAEPGWGRAVRLGLTHARGEVLCYTNSARTAAEDLLLFVLYGVANPNVVVKANRKIRDNWRRRLGSLLFALECRALFDLSSWDVNGTPKVFPRRFSRLLQLTRDDDLIDAEFNAVCRRHGYPMIEVPIFSTRRRGGRSTMNLRAALRMYWGVVRLWRERRAQEP